MPDIYNWKRKIERELERVKELNICEDNKRVIYDYYKHCVNNALSQASILNEIKQLRVIAKVLNKPFTEATKEDITKLIEEIESKEWAELTKFLFKAIIRKFYKWLRQMDDFPLEVKWIKLKLKNNNHRLPEEMLTEEEIKKLAEAAVNLRDKAFILTLYESGCRIGEILTMKIKNVQFDEYGAVLIVNGKTGPRRVRVVASSPILMNWLNNHPLKDNSDSSLWIAIGTRNRFNKLGYHSTLKMLKDLAVKVGIKKRINPHSFRHARATSLANKLTEAQMKELFGWVQSSKMASVYVHLSGRNVDNALLQIHGLAKEEDKKETVLKLKKCLRCQDINDPTSQFCKKCGSPLDIETTMKLEENRKKYEDFVFELLKRLAEKDPKVKKEFVELAKEKNIEEMFE